MAEPLDNSGSSYIPICKNEIVGDSNSDYTSFDLYNSFRANEVRKALLSRGLNSDCIDTLGDCDVSGGTNLATGIMKAAKIFKHCKINDFSGPELAMLLFSETWSPETSKNYRTRNTRCLSEMFGDEAKFKSEKYGMHVSSIQILRETSGNYSGNFYEAREYWKSFVPSETDFRESVRIPTPMPNTSSQRLADEVNFALGIIYGGAFISGAKTAKHPCRLFIRGDKKDVPLFENGLQLTIDSCFNVSDSCFNENRPTRYRDSTYSLPSIVISSMAVASWLAYDLGFPNAQTRNSGKHFPKIVLGEHAYIPFMSGFISIKGTPHNARGAVRFCSRDNEVLEQAAGQISRAGVPVSKVYEATCPFVEVTKQNVSRLFSVFDIRNPKLKKLIEANKQKRK